MIGRALRRLVVRAIARAINSGGNIAELRAAVDKSYPHHDEEWRRELWREAAERAAKVSR